MTRIFMVMLRQPRRSDPNEMRTDPFWEFGSFGLTGCHGRNLLHPRNWSRLAGSRLAFAQGGPGSVRLLALTPSVSVVRHPAGVELRWYPVKMPFCFRDAPALADNFGQCEAPVIEATLQDAKRGTMCGAFGSSFRSRTQPLPNDIADEIERLAQLGRPRAKSYLDAMPYAPPSIDPDREASYRKLLKFVGSVVDERLPSRCASNRRQIRQSCGSAKRVRRC
jgi:hypothetical protein